MILHFGPKKIFLVAEFDTQTCIHVLLESPSPSNILVYFKFHVCVHNNCWNCLNSQVKLICIYVKRVLRVHKDLWTSL